MKRLLMVILSAVLVAGCAKGDTAAEKRAYIQDMRKESLETIYAQDAFVRNEVAAAKGYAVFSNFNNNLLVVSAGSGYGVFHDNRTNTDTYMKMGTVGAGIGAGIKMSRTLMIFNDDKAMQDFLEKGFDGGAQLDIVAKNKEKGKSLAGEAANLKVKVYQYTDQGLALQATVQGYKYWKDDELNIK